MSVVTPTLAPASTIGEPTAMCKSVLERNCGSTAVLALSFVPARLRVEVNDLEFVAGVVAPALKLAAL